MTHVSEPDTASSPDPATEDDDGRTYHAVVNHEEQYSIWPADRDLPSGWRVAGRTGTRTECLDWIEEVWTDMRPLSLRTFLEDQATRPSPPVVDEFVDDLPPLVERLAGTDHPVEVSLRPERTAAALRESVEQGYVLVRFTQTRGGTELGIEIDLESSRVDADFDAGTGQLHLEGDLTLDFVPVRCIVDLDVATLAGSGGLVACEPSPSPRP